MTAERPAVFTISILKSPADRVVQTLIPFYTSIIYF